MTQPFIDRYYVCEDLTPPNPLKTQTFELLDDAIAAYKELPANKVKALGIQNSAPMPGSLDFVQCHNGKNVLIRDFERMPNWRNAEILRAVQQLREKLPLEEQRILRFITPEYDDLFTIADGESIRLRYHDGSTRAMPCHAHPDGYHFELGKWNTFHICEFAEICRRNGTIYEPAAPRGGLNVNTYDVYQISYIQSVDYSFRDYECAKEIMRPDDYKLVYSGMLGERLTLDSLFNLHNMDERPLPRGMRSVSMSDIIILHQNGESTAYYVDAIDFAKLPDTFCKALEPRIYLPEKTAPER